MGRERELSSLFTALSETHSGSPVVVYVHGPSGIGKSALLERYSVEVQNRTRAVVLEGRCYPSQQVPFKAFDGIVDGLGSYLESLSESEVARLLPRHARLLVKVFPALARVRAMLQAPEPLQPSIDSYYLRGLAFAALKELLARIADLHQLVLFIDDLQWGDLDSAQLFHELLSPPHAPACLVVCTYHSAERTGSPVLNAWLDDAASTLQVREVALIPFDDRVATLHGLAAADTASLPSSAQQLLQLVCAAGHPLPIKMALDASAADASALQALLGASLVRIRNTGGSEQLEPYHDRIRESVLATLPEARMQQIHATLASAYARTQKDYETALDHALRAGLLAQAASYALPAAEKARASLAFVRAMERLKLACEHASQDEAPALRIALAEAAVNAGYLEEAAVNYELAATALEGAASYQLRYKAVQLYLCSGHYARGTATLRALCVEGGVSYPKPLPIPYVMVSFWMALRQRMSVTFDADSVHLVPRLSAAAVPDAQRRMELAWAAGCGLVAYAPLDSARFLLVAKRLTRDLADPRYVPLAIVMDNFTSAVMLGSATADMDHCMGVAEKLATNIGEPQTLASVISYAASYDVYVGRLKKALQGFDELEHLLGRHGVVVSPSSNFSRSGRILCWFLLGDLTQIVERVDGWLRQSRAFGDLLNYQTVGVMGAHRLLVSGDGEGAQAAWDEASHADSGFPNPLVADPWWGADIALYRGRPDQALPLCTSAKRHLQYWLARVCPIHRTLFAACEARVGLAMRDAGFESSRGVRLARGAARRLRAERFVLARPMAAQADAALAFIDGDLDRTLSYLSEASREFAEQGMILFAAASDYRLGELMGGESGRTRMAEARARFVNQGAVDPDRWISMLAPGFATSKRPIARLQA